jgi:uncharacterized NAD(P)/FAD-binding protein YdhS
MCDCKLCVRHREFESQLAKIPGVQAKQLRDYFRTLLDCINEAEFDSAYYRAIVDGSWPQADELIDNIRKQRLQQPGM